MDKITREWFDFDKVTVKFDGDAGVIEEWLSGQEIARLVGAPKGSEITVSTDGKVIGFQVENAVFNGAMWRYLIQNPEGDYIFHIENRAIDLKNDFSNNGIGTRCVIHEIYGATGLQEKVPITHIETWAIGNIKTFYDPTFPLRGYYVWPSIGFDAAIPPAIAKRLEQRFQKCNRIIELMGTEEGRLQWMDHGDEVHVCFDLRPGSPSWDRLRAYMKEKGIEL